TIMLIVGRNRLRMSSQEIRYRNPVQYPLGILQQLRQASIAIGFDTDAKLCTEFAAVQDDALTERLARRIVNGKRSVDVRMTFECFCQSLGLGASFGYAKSNVWTRGRGCIANERHATRHQAWRIEIVNWR